MEDICYNLDKNVVTMSKNYYFHNCVIKDDSSDDNIEENNEVDINYDDIDPKTNKKKKNIKKPEKKIVKESENIEELFKSFSFFDKK